jgi:hypothetical protein
MREPTWIDRIAAAEQRGRFKQEDIDAAADWVTCGCGEQDPRIPRNAHGEPCDFALAFLGRKFFDMVDAQAVSEARALLGEIEARAAELLAGVAR